MLGVYSCLFLMSLVSFQHLFSFVDIFLLLFFRISFSYCSLRCSRTFRLQELLSVYVGILRRFMMAVAASVLLVAYIRYTDPLQESLRLLQQLQDTQSSLQEALQRAESLCQKQKSEDRRLQVKSHAFQKSELHRRVEERGGEEEEEESPPTDGSHLSHSGSSVVLSRTSKSSPLVHSVLVEEPRPRYRLRSRKSESRS
ncbi:uncharacterized protein LOC127532770 isoform X3 [Acanthochromis polyacanthus]|uniref:uncharacterized protein LOC127532770 isoform X3 n=1 Tax=Acanthochromis polyacanthus TaxID=80966 RepID=UPI00223451BF|nr:uncharacterized protein LOC127532770 isoform X3 [Acanthochromis polyacanthus]